MACFFGFGSLVNTATHRYVAVTPARVSGWARVWVNNDVYEHAFLSVTSRPNIAIQGLMAEVPNDDWQELDLREAGYTRLLLGAEDWLPEPAANGRASLADRATELLPRDVQMYQHASGHFANIVGSKPILWSYLETVLSGYYQWFGAEGVRGFVSSTGAWTEILDDRQAPRYPRYVQVGPEAADLVIAEIEALR